MHSRISVTARTKQTRCVRGQAEMSQRWMIFLWNIILATTIFANFVETNQCAIGRIDGTFANRWKCLLDEFASALWCHLQRILEKALISRWLVLPGTAGTESVEAITWRDMSIGDDYPTPIIAHTWCPVQYRSLFVRHSRSRVLLRLDEPLGQQKRITSLHIWARFPAPTMQSRCSFVCFMRPHDSHHCQRYCAQF